MQCALDLCDEVRVPGRIDQVDGQVVNGERRDSRLDRDPAAAFLGECVGAGVAGVDASEVVGRSGVEEQTFGEAGFTGVDVGKDAQIQGVQGSGPLRAKSSDAKA